MAVHQESSLQFFKYHGTGNDFIFIDNRTQALPTRELGITEKAAKRLCDRRYGIGGDGLILLQDRQGYDFEMIYINSDGSEATMCGNGARCIIAFAKFLGIIESKADFLALDGPHEGKISNETEEDTGAYMYQVELKLCDVSSVEVSDGGEEGVYYVLDTGTLHYVRFVENVESVNVVEEGRRVRYSERFQKEGVNVNFVEVIEQKVTQHDEDTQHEVTQHEVTQQKITQYKIKVVTYERGVEDETLSCGTGGTASAIASFLHSTLTTEDNVNALVSINVRGGELKVKFHYSSGRFRDVWLIGPAVQVFKGEIRI